MARFSGGSGSGSGAPGPQGPQGPAGADANTANFVFDLNNMSTNEDMTIGVNGVPGTINLSAYLGVDLAFAQAEGAGLRFPDNTIQTTAYTGGGGDADLGDFVFTAGTATVNENEILNITANDSDEVRAQLVLDPNNGIVKLEAFTNQNSNTFYASNPDWDSSTWVTDGGNGSIITFVNAPNIINFMSTDFNALNNVKISVNGGTAGTWNGGSYGPSDITIYIDGVLPPEDTTINDFSFLYNEVSSIEIDQDNGEININAQLGNNINISAGDDLTLSAAQDDVRIWANDDIRFTSNWNNNGDEHYWTMNSEGGLEFPGSGNISNPSGSDDITISSDGGQFLNDPMIASNQIATIGDLANEIPVEVSFSVNGGTLGDQPTFNGSPLFSGTYVKHGPMVHFQIQVDMDNILTFGTGQYFVDLPFPAKYGYQVKEGCLHDVSTGNQYAIGGHVYAGQSRLNLTYTNSNGQDEVFDFNSPIGLTTEDNFHIAGTYIAE